MYDSLHAKSKQESRDGVAMIWPVLAFSVLAAFTVVQCNQGCPSGYSRGQYLDASTQKYLLCWKVDWSDMSITFSAKVATAGWIGLGFSPTGFMPNSDVVIGWVKDGQGYLKVGTKSCTCCLHIQMSRVGSSRKLLSFRIVLQLRGRNRRLIKSKTSNCCRLVKQTG